MIEKAVNYATKAHEGQVRKGGDIPFISHPIAVASMILSHCSEKTVAAALLHDTIEDTDVTYEDLVREFGKEVADMVLDVTEKDKSASWKDRKTALLNEIPDFPIESLKIKTADNYHNLSSIEYDLMIEGEKTWDKFNAPKTDQKWYFTSLVAAIEKRANKENDETLSSLLENLKETVGYVFK